MKSEPCPLCGKQASFFSENTARHFFRCGECGLVFLDPCQRLTRDEELKRYQFHQNDPQDLNYRKYLNQLAEPLVECLPAGACGLDYGCGPGPTLSKMLEERGFNMQVYDPYFASETDVLTQTYDFITCSEAAEHFFNPRREFDRFDVMLKPGGWLGVLTQRLKSGESFANWHYVKDPTHVSFYSEETMRWIAEHYHWEIFLPQEILHLSFYLFI